MLLVLIGLVLVAGIIVLFSQRPTNDPINPRPTNRRPRRRSGSKAADPGQEGRAQAQLWLSAMISLSVAAFAALQFNSSMADLFN